MSKNTALTLAEKVTNAFVWIEAMTGGYFSQQQGLLGEYEEGFCCLGLGCFLTGVAYRKDTAFPPTIEGARALSNTMGMLREPQHDPYLEEGKGLAEMNDSGWSFEAIAEEVCRYPDRYFEYEVAKAIKEAYPIIKLSELQKRLGGSLNVPECP